MFVNNGDIRHFRWRPHIAEIMIVLCIRWPTLQQRLDMCVHKSPDGRDNDGVYVMAHFAAKARHVYKKVPTYVMSPLQMQPMKKTFFKFSEKILSVWINQPPGNDHFESLFQAINVFLF